MSYVFIKNGILVGYEMKAKGHMIDIREQSEK
jgi:hypothetical protein